MSGSTQLGGSLSTQVNLCSPFDTPASTHIYLASTYVLTKENAIFVTTRPSEFVAMTKPSESTVLVNPGEVVVTAAQ